MQGVATNVAEPLDAKKQTGWAPNEAPPSSYDNWLLQKTHQYLGYLDWRQNLETIVEEDFLGDSVRQPLVGAPTAYPEWYRSSGMQSVVRGDPGYLDSAMGLITWAATASGIGEWTTRVGRLRDRDFRMDFRVGQAIGHSGGAMAFGLFHMSGASGAYPRLGFVASGVTGMLGVQWQPSGAAAPTSIGMSFGMAPTSLHLLTLENRKPTMAIYYDDALVAAVPSPGEVGASGVPMDFGVVTSVVSPTGAGGWIDRVYLGVRRSP